MKKITKDEIKVGDYAYVDGCSGFCTGSYEQITALSTRYDEITGDPYDVVICGNNIYRKDNGETIKGAKAYSVFGYYRQ